MHDATARKLPGDLTLGLGEPVSADDRGELELKDRLHARARILQRGKDKGAVAKPRTGEDRCRQVVDRDEP